jgi:hypothetical protein
MNKITKEAISEAKRFIRAAEKCNNIDSWSSTQRAAAKRASMDLSRILAQFRKTQACEWDRK